MRLIANEKSIPRIHLVGTLLIVLLLTVGLSGYIFWQSRQDAQSSLNRIEQALAEQVEASLKAEMHNALTTIEFIRSRTEAVLRENLMQQVDSAYQIAETIYTQESALQSAAEVRRMIVEMLRPVRFYDGRGYFFIDDMNGQFILLPTSPELEGKTLIDNLDDTGHFIMRGLIAAARLPRGEGFSRYRWYSPDNPKVMAEKLSYVRYFQPCDWLIGTGDYLYKWEERQKQEAILQLRTQRFGTTGYNALFDAGGQSLISPSNAALEGKTEAGLPVFERSVLEKLLSTARAGGGIVHYDWPQADTGTLAKKTAYVQTYAPWQWVVVTTRFDDEMHAAVVAEQRTHAQLSDWQALTIALAGLAALLLGLAASWIFSRWMHHLFEGYHRNNLAQQDALRQQADELQKNQVTLSESERFTKSLLEAIPVPVFYKGRDGRYQGFNQAFLHFYGKNKDELIGKSVFEIAPPDIAKVYHAKDLELFENSGIQVYPYKVKNSQNNLRDVIFHKASLTDGHGVVTGIIGAILDVTELKQAVEAVEKIKALLNASQRLSMVGGWEWDVETQTMQWTEETYRIHDFVPGDLEPRSAEHIKRSVECYESEDRPKILAAFQRCVKEGQPYDLELPFTTVKGRRLWIRTTAMPVIESGKVIRVIGNIMDITELKQANEELSKSEERNRQIIHSSIDGFWRVDAQTRLIEVNEAYCSMSGYSREELLTKAVPDLEASESPDEVVARIRRIVENGSDRFTTSHRRKDGRIFEVEVSIQYRSGEDGGEFAVFLRDVTEKRRLESQLLQAQKLEAIGTLAGGIAHDFNNILGAIVGYAEIIRDDFPPGSPGIHDINQVIKASHRAKDLVKQILAFSRQVEDQKIPIQPAVIVKEAITLLRSSLPTTITIKQDIAADAGMVLADPIQIHQIVMNLCTNAFHAMEAKGGTLTISLHKNNLSQDDLATEPDLQPGTFVQLSIRDTGEGILPENRERIFDPFFTTKEVGKGTGLGLSTVYSIVKSCNGSITCNSRLGEGTEFRILLPVLEGHAVQENESTGLTPHGKEHILLIDDEEMLVDLGKIMLERLGYHVTTRRSSLDALDTFHNQPDAFDLIITDQTMPGMTGIDLARRMLQIRPDLPIILCTGYSNQISEDTARYAGIKGFVFKPLVKKDMGELIRKILDGKNS